MALIAVTSGAAPAFISKNYINRDCKNAGGIVVSTGDTLKHRLYDGDPTGAWNSVGSSDATTETITVALYQGALQVSRSIDFMAFLNVNIKNFLLEYSNDDGATYTTVIGGDYTSASLAAADLLLPLATPITANKIRLTMTTTQTANAEKSIGQWIAALGTFQTAKNMTAYEPTWEEGENRVEMGNRTKAYSYTLRSDNSFELYSAAVGWRFVASAERDSFRSVKNTADPFLWMPFPGDQTRAVYLCKMLKGTFKDPFSTTYIGAGYDISFELEEVGGG